jgi:hypothetical protein
LAVNPKTGAVRPDSDSDNDTESDKD